MLAIQGGSVTFDEQAGSPTFSAQRDELNASRVGLVTWSDINALWLECFPPAAGTLPGTYPGISYLFAQGLEIGAFHPDPGLEMICTGSVAAYLKAKVTIKYSTKLPGNDPDPSDLITRKYGCSGEFLTLNSGGLFWEPDSIDDPDEPIQEEEVSAARIIPMIDHSLTRNRAASIPWASIQANIGLVNGNAINNAYFTNVPIECLLFMGSEIGVTLSTDGSRLWTLEHKFQERRIIDGTDIRGWNHFLQPGGASGARWRRIVNASGDPVYSYSPDDFVGLFA